MTLRRLTKPASEPLTVAAAKRHLRETLVDDDNDTDIGFDIVTARTAAEDRMKRTILPSSWQLTLDRWPQVISLERPPIISVDEISYVDPDGVTRVLQPSAYLVDVDSEPGRIFPAYGSNWPSARCFPGSVKVKYTAGYASAADVPGPIVSWIKLALGDLYDQRSRSAEKPAVPLGFADGLLDAYCVWSA